MLEAPKLLLLLSQPCSIKFGIWEEVVRPPAELMLPLLMVLEAAELSCDKMFSSQTSMGTSVGSFAASVTKQG